LWHNQLLLSLLFRRTYDVRKRLVALVSASKDGAWLAALFDKVGVPTVRGSSNRFGREALRSLIDSLQQGDHVAITPDGPRGPAYSLEGGAIVAARRAGAEIVLIGADIGSAWRLDSWDGFFIPKPFAKINVKAERIRVPDLRVMKEPIQEIRDRLYAMAAAVNEADYAAPPRFRRATV